MQYGAMANYPDEVAFLSSYPSSSVFSPTSARLQTVDDKVTHHNN